MKIKFPNARYLAIPALAVIFFALSCNKDSSSTPATTQETAAQITEASTAEVDLQNTFDDVFDNVAGIDGTTAGEDLGIYGNNGFGIFPGEATGINTDQNTTRCFTVSVTPKDKGVFPKTVVLDFGSGCTMNGHTRKGKIITVYSGPLHKPGNTAVTTFDGFYIDSFKVEGKHTVLNSTEPGSNQRSFTRIVENARVTNINSNFWRTWSGTRIMKQLEGNGTPFYALDDIYQFTGTRKGENSKGRSWTAETITPLIKAFTCKWISKGQLKITVNGKTGVIDFGNGDCDNKATLTIEGVSKEITLR